MRRSAGEIIRNLEMRIARLEKQARPIDPIQEGLEEMGSYPFKMTPKGIIDYLFDDLQYDRDLYHSNGHLEKVVVTEVVRGVKIEISSIHDHEMWNRVQGGSSELDYTESSEWFVVDYTGRVKNTSPVKSQEEPISKREYERRYKAIERVPYEKLVSISL